MNKGLLHLSVAGVLSALIVPQARAQQAAPSDATTIGEVVVTAQRFSETAQRTPLAIQVLGAEQLKGVTDVRQLGTLTPGVNISPAGNVMQTYIRGVGSGNATSQQEAAVSYNVDGVFLSTTSMVSTMMYDLDRIEVLKGPQGTLYGRNSSGGAINIITTGAKLHDFNGYVEGEVGNYSLGRFLGAVNVPVGDDLALRFALTHVGRDGYLSDGLDDQHFTAGRLRGLWQPSSVVTAKFGADFARIDQMGAGSSFDPAHNPTDDKFIGGMDPRAQTGIFVPTLPFTGATACGPGTFNPNGTSLLSCPPNTPPYFKVDQASGFAQFDVDLGFATLTLLPALRNENINSRSYLPGYQYDEISLTREKTFEARLSNSNKLVRWVAGAFYYDNKQSMRNVLRNEVFSQGATVDLSPEVESYAFFGEATFSVTEKFRLIGGLRYTHEKSDFTGQVNATNGPPGLPGSPTSAAFSPFFLAGGGVNPVGEVLDYNLDDHDTDSAVTWKAGAEYDLAPDSLLFFTASKGYKAGGFYADIPIADSSFKPEFVTAYELGSRNRFLNGSLQLNLELFYWKLRNQQIPYVGFNSVQNITFITANAASSTMYGADVDVTWRPTRADTFHVSVEWLHAYYDNFVRTLPSLAVPPDTVCGIGPTYSSAPGSTVPATVDCSGLRMIRTAPWTGSASYQHTFDLGDAGTLAWDADLTFSGARYTYIAFTPETHDNAYVMLNSSLEYRPENKPWTVTAWAKNLTNKRAVAAGSQINTPYSRDLLMPPRTYGVTARYSF